MSLKVISKLEALGIQVENWDRECNVANGKQILVKSEVLHFKLFIKDLDRQSFEAAYKELIIRHEGLRTVFCYENGTLWQLISEYNPFHYQLHYFDVLSKESQNEFVSNEIRNSIKTVTKLEKGPLIQSCLFKIDSVFHLYYCVLHHIISDAWSLEILKSDLSILYKYFKYSETDSLLPNTCKIEDAVKKQNRFTKGSKNQEERRYWLTKFSEYDGLINYENLIALYSSFLKKYSRYDHELKFLNTNRYFKNDSSQSAGSYYLLLAAPFADKLRYFSENLHISRFSIIQSVFGLLFYFFNDQPKTFISVSNNGRKLNEEKSLVGHIMYKIYFGRTINENSTIKEYFTETYIEFIRLSSKHPIYNEGQYDYIGVNNFTNIYLNYIDKRSKPFNKKNKMNIHEDAGFWRYSLSCYIEDHEKELIFHWVYDRDAFCAGLIEFIINIYNKILAYVSDFPDKNIHSLKTEINQNQFCSLISLPDSNEQCYYIKSNNL